MPSLFEPVIHPLLIVSIGVVTATALSFRVASYAYLPDSIPWVGCRKELFSKLRANLREYRQGLQFLDEGYTTYSKDGKSFITPNATLRPEVLLPSSQISWLFKQPGDILSARAVQKSLLATDYVLPRQTFENDFHIEVARIALTRQLGALIDSIVDELRLTMDGVLGSNTEDWTEVNLSSAMLTIIMRSNARVFVGLPLCRDKTYLTLTYQYSMAIVICGSIIRVLIPDVLKPIFGPIFALPYRWYAWRCNRYLVPIIKSRSANMQLSKTDGGCFASVSSSDTVPNDLLQHIILAAYSSPSLLHCSPHIISANLAMLNTAATHTTHLTIVHALLDLLSHYSPGPSPSPLEHIRAEASAILASHNNTWTRAAVAQLHRADSAIRESLRYTTMGGRGSMRQVTPACGVRLPSGETVPQGVWVGLPVAAIHHDAAFYPEPDAYLPFRFANEREKLQAESGGPKALEASRLAMTTTSHTFLPFSHGRHACPGRFYAAQLLKLLLAELVLRYDVRGLEERPKNMIMSDLTVPPNGVSVWVKRRSSGDEKGEGEGKDRGSAAIT